MKIFQCGTLSRAMLYRLGSLTGLFLLLTFNLVSFDLVSTGCGGSASPSADIPAPVVSISATVTSPSATTSLSALSNGKIKYQVEDTPVAGVLCHFYTLEGELLGEATTDAAGECTCEAPVDDLAGSEDAGSTTWSEPFVVHCENGIELYSEIDYTEGTTTDFDAGTADTDTTLAAEETFDAISDEMSDDYDPGDDASTVKDSADFTCLYEAAHAMWGNSGLEDEGIAGDSGLGLIADAMDAYFAAGGDPTALGYGSLGDFYDAAFGGTLDDDGVWDDILTTAGTVDSSFDPAVYGDAYDDSFTAYEALHSFLYEDLGGGGTAAASVSALAKRQTAEDLCGSIGDGTLDPSAIIAPMLAAEDLDEFNMTYGDDDGGIVFFGLLADCMATGCPEMIANPFNFTGFMSGYGGDFSSVYDSTTGSFADYAIDGIWEASLACTGSTTDEIETCTKAMWGTVYEGAGGWTDFYDTSTGTFDTAEFDYWGTYWVGQAVLGFDADTADIGSVCGAAYDTYGTTFDGFTGGGALDTCIAEKTADGTYAYWECYDTAGYTTDYNSYAGWNSEMEAGSAICGDYACTGDETAATCPNDCDTDYISDNPYYGLYCGDMTCSSSIGETSTNCCADCGGCSYTYCGDNTCSSDETATSCPIDCGEWCGNGTCGSGETSATCSADCGSGGGGSSCNYNAICESGETATSCIADCHCGDGTCQMFETHISCSADCP